MIKKWWFWLIVVIVTALAADGVKILYNERSRTAVSGNAVVNQPTQSDNQSVGKHDSSDNSDLGDANSTDPVERGKALSNGKCSGTGSKQLTSAPMRADDVSYIIPYGLLAGSHVTPIDHQYYWGKVPMGNPDSYDVLAPADGRIVDLEYRPHPAGSKVKGDYRVVISYSCTFLSYFDLATSLAPDIEASLPAGWEAQVNSGMPAPQIDFPVKAGQTIAKMGGQSLDFAVWDTTKTLPHLTVPVAYNNAEPWKINTVAPLNYYSDQIKSQILPHYLRTIEPRDGDLDQDIEGTAAGVWFKTGTNGYAGVFEYGSQGGGQNGYWSGHLALVHDLYTPSDWVFSVGDYQGQAQQFAITDPTTNPDALTVDKGMVKYQLADWQHVDSTGQVWTGEAMPKGNLTMKAGSNRATALVQLVAAHQLKVEVFPGKLPSAVTGFDSNATTYDRGDNAKMVSSNTAR